MQEHGTSGTVRGVPGNRHSYRRDAYVTVEPWQDSMIGEEEPI
jgi:hypothetical protein